jgi:hypothetical protein
MTALRVSLATLAILIAAACSEPTNLTTICENGVRITLDSAVANWRTGAIQFTQDLEDDDILEPIMHGLTKADSGIVTPYGGSVQFEFTTVVGSVVRITADGLRDMANDPLSDPDNKIASMEFDPEQCSVTGG